MDTPVSHAAQALIAERFEQATEMWQDGYSWEVEYDQIDIFLENDSLLSIVFYDEHATVRGKRATSARFEYVNPEFDDLLIQEVRKRLHV